MRIFWGDFDADPLALTCYCYSILFIVSKETVSMEAQRPEPEAADFTLAWLHDLMLPVLDWCSDPTTTSPGRDRSPMCSHPSLTVAAKWINCRQTTIVQVALAGPGTLVTLVVATSCTLFLERKLCSANSKRSPKASFDFSVCRLSNNPKATRSISAT